MGERWRPVVGWEGLYDVSDYGRVWSRYREGRILKQKISHGGNYYGVTLNRDGKQKTIDVHRLVALAFVPGSGQLVRHLDGDGFHNFYKNLAWGTYFDNAEDARRHGSYKLGEAHHSCKLTAENVAEIRRGGFGYRTFAKRFGVSPLTIRAVVIRTTWRHVP